jgi:selenocysteine-specific elongation factor
MIIGTAGHVDHGKTALVKALTGVDTDRLAEEKRRGITIDLGYAYSGELGFIDVPGHERFVHTMLAGASGIDTALLVVSLPEGIKPQTREHLQILSLLGIDHGVVALTKADLAADRIAEVSAELEGLLAGTPLAGAAMIPVSAVTGEGIAALQAALLASTGSSSGEQGNRNVDGYPRLAVDRAFTLAGAGLIVTGTLVAGRIAVEDRLVLSPSGLELRVRGLHAQNKAASEAVAGQRVALNITGPRLSKEAVARGDWVLHPEIHAPTAGLDARITLLADAPRPMRQDTQVHLHLGAAHVMGRVSLLDQERLEPGAAGLVRLTLQHPIGALASDRIVLRDHGATCTLGGGVVLDPFPPRRGRRTPARLAQLEGLAGVGAMEALRGLLAVAPHWTEAGAFMRAHNVRVADRAALIASAPAMSAGGLILEPAAFESVREAVVTALAAHHAASPELPGLQAERLRMVLAVRPPVTGFAGLLDAFRAEGVIGQDGPWFRLPGHRISLSPQDERVWGAVRPLIEAERFRPPRARDLAKALILPETAMRVTLKRLMRMGQLVEIAPDHFFLRETVAEMAGIAAEAVDAGGLLTAAAFRDRLDNGRKVAILILEFFDKAGITVRSGDVRRVRMDRLGLFGRVGD